MIRKKATFKGIVQGVGFRHFAYRICSGLSLSGFVKNCPDGSVVAEIQGDDNSVKQAIDLICEGPAYSCVESVKIENVPVKNESSFRVSF